MKGSRRWAISKTALRFFALSLLSSSGLLPAADKAEAEATVDAVKQSATRLTEVVPGAKQALEMASEKDVPSLTASEMEEMVNKVGGTLSADPDEVQSVLQTLADEGIVVRLSDVKRLVKGTPGGTIDSEVLQQWQRQQVPEEDAGAVKGRESADCPGLVYGAGKREICLPLGTLSFADRSVRFTAGQKPSKAPFDNPERALGEPNYRNTQTPDFISIGCDGELVVQFVDNVLVDVDGTDLYVFEVGPFVEKTRLAISTDGERWVEAGVIEGSRSDVDITSVAGPDEKYTYVKLTNAGRSCGGKHSGADIDAVAAVGAEIRLSLDSALLFDVGKAELKPEARAALDAMAAKVSGFGPGIRVTVEGHTDATGSDQDNLRLSEARASSVWRYLATTISLPDDRVIIKGYGESRPVASNEDEAGRALNRRVDLLIRP